MKSEEIIKIANANNGYIYSEIIKKYNIPTIYITRLVKANKLFKVARGIYITKLGIEDEYFIYSLLYSHIIFSGELALFLNSLSNKQIVDKEISVRYGSFVPKIKEYKTIVSRKDTFNLGITQVETPFGNKVMSYDKERCICDLFVNPNKYDYEDRIFAINEYKREFLNLKRLYKYAKILKIYDEVRNVFEVISWN